MERIDRDFLFRYRSCLGSGIVQLLQLEFFEMPAIVPQLLKESVELAICGSESF